jgi:hypothetical protein
MAEAEVSLSKGNIGVATNDIIAALRLVDAMGGASVSSVLRTSIGRRSICANLSPLLGRLPLATLVAIQSETDSQLQRNPFVQLVDRWRHTTQSVIDAAFSDPGADATAAQIAASVASLSPAARRALQKRANEELDSRAKEILQNITRPEMGWTVTDGPPAGDAAQILGLAGNFGNEFWTNVFAASIRDRTILRLLRLHCGIGRLRWEQGRVPLSLSSLPRGIVVDPLTGSDFVYKYHSASAYSLRSLGTPDTGPIVLSLVDFIGR